MTLIEPFDRSPLQNVAECLAIRPDRLILVGSDPHLADSKALYERILHQRNLSTQVLIKPISATATPDAICTVFEELIREYSPCAIDLFGGNEIYLVAAGMAYQNLRDSYDVFLQQMDMKRGVVVRLEDNQTVGERPVLTVAESVKLYGGLVFSEESDPAEDYTSAAIDPLWNIVKKNPGQWNKKLRALNFFESRSGCHYRDLDAEIDLYGAYGHTPDIEQNRRHFRDILAELEQAGAVTVYSDVGGCYRYRYANHLVRACLKKEGNLLEYKTFMMVREYAPDGKRFFHDCEMGVILDWDGVLHNPYGPDVRDTRNEIDIMAMRGCTPVFISCKNGGVDEDELYKLHTVAHQLGGAFAKKVLIATDYEPHSEKAKLSLMQRARDMGIVFETDAARFTDRDWHHFFERIFA